MHCNLAFVNLINFFHNARQVAVNCAFSDVTRPRESIWLQTIFVPRCYVYKHRFSVSPRYELTRAVIYLSLRLLLFIARIAKSFNFIFAILSRLYDNARHRRYVLEFKHFESKCAILAEALLTHLLPL